MSDPNQAFYDSIPDVVPKTNTPRATKLARRLVKILGWRFTGQVPAEPKVIGAIAPHTSNLDFIMLVFAKYALGIDSSYIMKKEAFFWPFKNLFISWGGIPIDRSQPTRIVSQVAKKFRDSEGLWIVITPEGTRKKVDKYKSGFARMAYAADVPVVILGFNYKEKTLCFDRCLKLRGDIEKEVAEIRDYCREKFVGKHPENQ